MKSFFRKLGLVFFILLLGFAGLVTGLRWRWLKSLENSDQILAEEMGQKLGVELVSGQVTPQDMYKDFISRQPRIGYIVMSNRRTGYRSGLVNTGSLSEGAQEVVSFFKRKGTDATLNRLIQKGEGFPSEHLDVYSIKIQPSSLDSNDHPIGLVKVAFVVPGYPYGRGYEKLWWIVSGIFSLFSLSFLGLWVTARFFLPASHGIPEPGALDELGQLEDALTDQPTVEIDEQGREWKIIFDGKELEGWRTRGDIYISEREIAIQPWGSSIVFTGSLIQDKYHFQYKAKRIAGPDGFILLFPLAGKNFSWVVGGWENTRSEVLGYIQTQRLFPIERYTWYKLEVRVEEEVCGFINDIEVFRLKASELQESSPDCGFQQGLGMATWSTFSKIKDVRALFF